jgi:tetratricopeptide (TPR) repeat protein
MATKMIERHYDDEALIALIDNDRVAADEHLPHCPPCSEKIESFRMICDALCDQDLWDTQPVRSEPVPATIANLRAFADRMADEDTHAEAILQELLAGSREEWMPRLNEHPEWRTAGVVRRLVAQAYTAVVAMPPDAVEIAELATKISDHLEPADQPSDTIVRLRGSAWRSKAYALYYVGDFSAAEAALCVSERHFSYCGINEYELARLGIVKALVLRPFERFAEATDVAIASAEVFEQYGDVEKTASARLAEVHMLFSREQYARAEEVLLDLESQMSAADYIATHARVLMNLGLCSRKLGKVTSAIEYYDCASALLDDIGARTETARIRWGVAVMLAEAGRVADACERLRAVMAEMEHLGMASEAAIAGLDVVELLLAQDQYEEVGEICRSSIATFERAGVAYSTRALTALGYIQEAAKHRRADQKLVRTVRDYIRRLPTQPNLLFAPPPA